VPDVTLELGLGLVAIFLAIILVFATAVLAGGARKEAGSTLAMLDAFTTAPAEGAGELDRPFAERVVAPAFRRLVALGRRLTPGGSVEKIRHRLEEAGSPPRWTVDRVLAFKMLGAVAGGVLGLAAAVLLHSGPVRLVGIPAVAAVAGFLVPNLALYQLAHGRAERIQRELPDSLDLLTITVEAGLAFDAALSQVARNTEGPLADEFFRVLKEMQIGMGRQEALKALGERANVADLRQFVTAMVQADSFGIPIGNVLRVQANEMRLKRSQRAEEKAQKVPVKILFPLIFCILPVLFIVVIGPAGVGIFHAFTQ
jgi:tight adherence protein C